MRVPRGKQYPPKLTPDERVLLQRRPVKQLSTFCVQQRQSRVGWESRVGGRGGQRRESVNIENQDNWRIRTAKNAEIRSTASKRKRNTEKQDRMRHANQENTKLNTMGKGRRDGERKSPQPELDQMKRSGQGGRERPPDPLRKWDEQHTRREPRQVNPNPDFPLSRDPNEQG